MEVRSVSWTPAQGWGPPLPTDLDSESTVVAAFAAPRLGGAAAPLTDRRTAFPAARVVGCSTAGEIVGSRLRDDTVAVGVARFDCAELVGFDSYGEIAPHHEGRADLHHQTMTITAIGEL